MISQWVKTKRNPKGLPLKNLLIFQLPGKYLKNSQWLLKVKNPRLREKSSHFILTNLQSYLLSNSSKIKVILLIRKRRKARRWNRYLYLSLMMKKLWRENCKVEHLIATWTKLTQKYHNYHKKQSSKITKESKVSSSKDLLSRV